jgi:hypothetical protein
LTDIFPIKNSAKRENCESRPWCISAFTSSSFFSVRKINIDLQQELNVPAKIGFLS